MDLAEVNSKLVEAVGFRVSEESDDDSTFFLLVEDATNEAWETTDFETFNEAVAYATTRLPHELGKLGLVFRDGRWVEA